ncbi:hypothetical protein WOLCODRAFT_137477 [Wolfiporia cocos MD-104 SS10]|uniref:Uncharacterized protein n=1 Tax=Wolfiporia cocos (strain MD-104) TaxID=742152 RepID=A0A2H3JHB9_WOLCO|nr:hypothetical protein WOLCODRAFT_137477 [Wolfiporia cocos MD-104 SS10]
MSLSVDDLVSAFNSNHIGQEAIDLANLHAQLAQVLRAQPCSSSQSIPGRRYPRSNTPLARTPSSSFSWESSEFTRGRSSSSASATHRWGAEERAWDPEDNEDDERMVEDMLLSPPASSRQNAASSAAMSSGSEMLSRQSSMQHISSSFGYAQNELPSPNSSMFATTDPFYTAQLQASQNPTSPLFAQAGRLPPHSPFGLAQQFQSAYNHINAHHPVPAEIDPHHMFGAQQATFMC